MYAYVDAAPPWLGEHIQKFIQRHEPDTTFVKSILDIPPDATSVFQYCSGQELNRHFALLTRVPKGLMNAYPNSDAVARKDHLAAVIDFWSTKRPDSILPHHCPDTVRLTLDYAEYVDEALMAADDLTLLASLEDNADKPPSARDWWILKPALVDCGAGIRLFSTIDELASHLELAEYEHDSDTESDSDSDCGSDYQLSPSTSHDVATTSRAATPTPSSPTTSISTAATTPVSPLSVAAAASRRPAKPTYTFVENGRIPSAQMRAFVAQRYLARPSTLDGRKWHCRAYVLAVGRLRVFVYREMLALLAGEAYAPPWEGPSLKASLTNTALQDEGDVERLRSMRDFWTGVDEFDEAWKEGVFGQICGVVSEVFKGAVNTMGDRFVAIDKCFELFAVDFLVDEDGVAWLLEVNETPAFYESPVTGPIAVRLMESVVEVAMGHMNGEEDSGKGVRGMVQVLDETANLGKSNITEILPEEAR
ncbi:tubulin-tyrosine ligase family-domain-containing protein [Podospora conica]|nr:tubulin-tyrosine ligase family-domain-containing protein [Schizothecium conicum]